LTFTGLELLELVVLEAWDATEARAAVDRTEHKIKHASLGKEKDKALLEDTIFIDNSTEAIVLLCCSIQIMRAQSHY
jgi:hypothetical protein